MPFDKTPAYSTYQTKSIALFKQQNNRGSNVTKDEDYLNVYIEQVKNKILQDLDQFIVKRPGTALYMDNANADTVVRGVHYNQDFKKLYYAIGDKMYIWNVATNALSTSIAAFFGTTTGDVGFCDYLYDSGSAVVIATDGTTLKQIDSANTVTACVDADMPVHIPQPVFLDGYIFVVKSGTADIYNSNLNDPMNWTAGDFISAEINPDNLSAIAKLNNYIVVLGTTSIEYFWDAGNASGSPLQRNDTPVKFNGYLGGLAQHGQKLYFIGNDVNGQPNAFILEDFKIEAVGDQNTIRYWSSAGTAYTSWKGTICSFQGHDFYTVNTTATAGLLYVMDIETKLWSRWTFQQSDEFGITFAVNVKNASTYKCLFVQSGASNFYYFDPTLYQDAGVNFTCQGVTDNEEFDTYRQKFMQSLIVWADKPTSAASLSLSWSDDDYQTFSTPISIALYQEVPNCQRLGRFRRRAFKWSFTANQPFRLMSFEVDLNMGQY